MMDEEVRPSHKLIGILGIILLIIYVILSLMNPTFKLIALRFLSLFTAVGHGFEAAYLLVPIYINWLSTDYFVERRKTSLGNAATNGFTGLWIGVNWIRWSYLKFYESANQLLFVGKLLLAVLMLTYMALILKESIQGRSIAHLIGRVREVSYIAIVVTPLILDLVPFDWMTFAAIIIFYPLFYGIVEFLEFYVLPVPKTLSEEAEED